jgi:succinylarginine dihydrolase
MTEMIPMPIATEINFDGIVGPTHNYAGLSRGNLASEKHASSVSHPKAAALQGLAKMKFLYDLGVRQAVLPPHRRPDLGVLRSLGFEGSDGEVLQQAHRQDPRLLAAVYSASAMWAANAATVSPSADASDHRVHFTPANLLTQFHRSLETATTARILRAIFPADVFMHHDPLPAAAALADEGAANHMRLCPGYDKPGIEILVYGRSGERSPAKFPARQTLDASQSIARRHHLDPQRTVFARQNPAAIDAGAFHNDVVAVSNQNMLLIHADALADQSNVLQEISAKYNAIHGQGPVIISADSTELTLEEAVQTYVFNSQIVTLSDGSMALIAPIECRDHARVQQFLQRVLASSPIRAVHYQDVHQSMNNGGGPACLRLRVVVTPDEFKRINPGVLFTPELYTRLKNWIERHYRDSLAPEDLAHPRLKHESEIALAELAEMLGIPDICGATSPPAP